MEPENFDNSFQERCPQEQMINDIDIFLSLQQLLESPPEKSKKAKGVAFAEPNEMISWGTITEKEQKNHQFFSSAMIDEKREGLFASKSCRSRKFIEVSDKKRRDYVRTLKGAKQQTSQLNINYKTLTKTLMKEEFLFNDFSQSQEDVIRNFQKSNANFASFRELYGVQELDSDENQLADTNQSFRLTDRRVHTEKCNKKDVKNQFEIGRKSRKIKSFQNRKYIVTKKSDRIRKICLKNFSSCKVIRETLQSSRMNPLNKIVTLKFLEQVRDGCLRPQDFCHWKDKIDISNAQR